MQPMNMENTLYLILGISRCSVCAEDADNAADSIRLVTADAGRARAALDRLNAEMAAYIEKTDAYWVRLETIQRTEFGNLLDTTVRTGTPEYGGWLIRICAARQRFITRRDAEIGEPPPRRPIGMPEAYLLLEVPAGTDVNIALDGVCKDLGLGQNLHRTRTEI